MPFSVCTRSEKSTLRVTHPCGPCRASLQPTILNPTIPTFLVQHACTHTPTHYDTTNTAAKKPFKATSQGWVGNETTAFLVQPSGVMDFDSKTNLVVVVDAENNIYFVELKDAKGVNLKDPIVNSRSRRSAVRGGGKSATAATGRKHKKKEEQKETKEAVVMPINSIPAAVTGSEASPAKSAGGEHAKPVKKDEDEEKDEDEDTIVFMVGKSAYGSEMPQQKWQGAEWVDGLKHICGDYAGLVEIANDVVQWLSATAKERCT